MPKKPAPPAPIPLKLIPDTAWGEFAGMESEPCELGFEGYASILSNVALNTQGPFTIGVFGDWGTGKSSLMRLTKAKVEAEKGVVAAWFNAWQYERDENPIIPLIATIVRALQASDSSSTKAARSLVTALRSVAYSATIKAGPLEFSAKDVIDREKQLSDPLLERSLYYDAFNLLNEATKGKDRPSVVVFIDDLDRCLLDKALELLEYIKLVLAQPGFIFFLGLDRRIIESYLKKRFQKDFEVPNFSGREYLDKLVQLSFQIPSHARRIEEFSKHMVGRVKGLVSESESKQLAAITPIFGLACHSNPRAVIRYLNSLMVARAIADKTGNLEDLPLSLFAISLALQERWERIHALLQRYETSEKILDFLEYDESKRESMKDDAKLKGDYQLKRIVDILIDEEELRKLLATEPGKKYLKTPLKDRLATTEFLAATATKEEPKTEESADLRQRWPWAESFTEDHWPVVRGFVIKPGTYLEGANLERVNLSLANLEGAKLRSANLNHANLAFTNLQDANLGAADLGHASFEGANLTRASLFNANLAHANFHSASLKKAILKGANLQSADLGYTDLEYANLLGSFLEGTNLEGANLESASLPASIEEIKNTAICNDDTIWPDGSKG